MIPLNKPQHTHTHAHTHTHLSQALYPEEVCKMAEELAATLNQE